MGLGFTPKLRLAPLWPALAAVFTASALLWVLLPSLFERSASVQLLDTLDVLAPLVVARLDAAPPPAGDLQGWVRGLAAGGGLRITVIDGDGTPLADSARTREQLARMENHASRPEVREALATGRGSSVRRSATTGHPYVYAARTLAGRGGRLYVLRLAQPLAQIAALRGRLATAMALAVAAAALAGLLLSLWIDRRLFQPLARLIGGAGELSSGRYDYRLEVPEEDELAALALAINRLAATVQGQFAALSKERDHLKAILAGMSEGVLVVGADGRAVLANPALRRLFDLREEVAGRPVLELVRLPELARLIDETLARGQGQESELVLPGPERRSIQLASAALSGAGPLGEKTGEKTGEEPGGAVVVARETTELRRLIEVRRDFVANVSHELKTPLAAIRGYAETLRDGALAEPETAERFTDRILRQCRRLQALLDDLLTLSRLESLQLPPKREPVDLKPLAERAIELMSSAAEERQVRLRYEAVPLDPVPGDADGLERLLVNLLDNGIKYNRPGGEVRLRLLPRPGEVVIEVADTGIGIPQESIPRLFERFYRVDKGRSREEGGTGLGLAIVKHVAQAHGGQVEVESRIGRGSTFRVHLPAAS
jgi:two-component system, OmpR family, phosphate regulon sensor histidine kinase PhoR